MKIILTTLFTCLFFSNANAQQLPSFKQIEQLYNKSANTEEGKKYRFLNKKKDGEFLLFCYQNGKVLERYNGLKLKSFESKFLFYDVVTVDGRIIRVPNTCFIEAKK